MREVEKEDDLIDALKIDKKVCVLFYASWCPFCRSFLPIFIKETQMNVQCKFLHVKLDDEENSLWAKYDIEVVPTVIFFDSAKVLGRLDGVLGVGLREEQLRSFLYDIVRKASDAGKKRS